MQMFSDEYFTNWICFLKFLNLSLSLSVSLSLSLTALIPLSQCDFDKRIFMIFFCHKIKN